MEALEVGLQKKKVVISYEDEEYKSYIGISPPEDFLSTRFKLNEAKRGKMIRTLILEGYIAGKKDDFSVNLQKVRDDYNFSPLASLLHQGRLFGFLWISKPRWTGEISCKLNASIVCLENAFTFSR